MIRGTFNKFPDFFVWALLLIVHTWNSSSLRSNLHRLQCTCCTVPKIHWEQGLDYREGEELSWCPSWPNSLWQGWSCGLVHCPTGNATDPISRVLAFSQWISSWTPLKPLPKPFGQLTLMYWLPYSSHTSHHPPQTPCLPWISYATQKLMLDSGKIEVWSIAYVSVAFSQV